MHLQHQGSDDDSDVLLRRGMVLYDFSPEEEDEVAVSKGEAVEIEYEVGGWIQVGRPSLGRVGVGWGTARARARGGGFAGAIA